MVKLDLDLDPDPDLDPHSEKLLDPDPHKMNSNPQPWRGAGTFVTASILATRKAAPRYCEHKLNISYSHMILASVAFSVYRYLII